MWFVTLWEDDTELPSVQPHWDWDVPVLKADTPIPKQKEQEMLLPFFNTIRTASACPRSSVLDLRRAFQSVAAAGVWGRTGSGEPLPQCCSVCTLSLGLGSCCETSIRLLWQLPTCPKAPSSAGELMPFQITMVLASTSGEKEERYQQEEPLPLFRGSKQLVSEDETSVHVRARRKGICEPPGGVLLLPAKSPVLLVWTVLATESGLSFGEKGTWKSLRFWWPSLNYRAGYLNLYRNTLSLLVLFLFQR